MHFRFHFDGPRFDKACSAGAFAAGRGRWGEFARAFADEFGSNGPGGPDGFGRRRRRFGAEALRIIVLHLLKTEARHGYELIKAIEALSGGLYAPSPGMIYPLLALLADEGLIVEVAGEEGRRRYAITAAGEAALAAAETQLRDVLDRLAELARSRSDDAREPMRAALHDLKAAARQRMARDDADKAVAERIATILKDAARAIADL